MVRTKDSLISKFMTIGENKVKKAPLRLRIAQCIAKCVALGIPVTPEELQFSFQMADEYGDDAIWQQ